MSSFTKEIRNMTIDSGSQKVYEYNVWTVDCRVKKIPQESINSDEKDCKAFHSFGIGSNILLQCATSFNLYRMQNLQQFCMHIESSFPIYDNFI